MSLFKNLARLVEAPIQIIDRVIVEPIANLAEDAADTFAPDETKPQR